MSAQLNLSGEDIQKLTTCWSSLQANNKYHKDDFITRLFSNLVAANPKLRKVFYSESIITEQSTLFGDLLSFTMLYLDDEYTLSQCMNAFLKENPKFVKVGSQYLEPMGSALIVTFRQWLGQGKFNEQIQSLWVQVYLYIANCLLQFEESSSETRSLEEPPIEALRPRRRPPVEQITKEEAQQGLQPETQQAEPLRNDEENNNIQQEVQHEAPEPEVVKTKSIKPLNTSTIQFQLSNNEKYKGFRRSVQSSETEPISIQIPSTPTFQQVTPPLSPPSAPFDPRKMRSLSRSPASLNEQELTSSKDDSSFDPRTSRRKSPSAEPEQQEGSIITPRSSRRTSIKELVQEPEPIQQQPQSQPEAQSQQQTYKADPRKMAFTKPSNIISDDSDDEFAEKEKTFGFDPRRLSKRKSQSPIISDEESEFEPTSPLFISHSRETSVSDVEDDSYNFEVKEPSVERTSKPSAFDYNSFGIKGLEPIVESEFDETASSKYESDEDIDNDNASSQYGARSSSDADEISSGVSTLSLHNSDYRSSINSGSDATSVSPSPDFNKFQMGHGPRQASTSSDVSSMKPLSDQIAQPPSTMARPQSSCASLSSTYQMSRTSSQQQFKQRASLGFMRSSFILKKEIAQQGLNEPENVLLKPPTIPAATNSSSLSSSKTSTTSLQSTLSSGTGSDGCYDLLNSFVPVTNLSNEKQATKTMASSVKATPRHTRSNSDLQSTKSLASTESKRRSLRSRLSSIFSSSSSNTTTRKSSLACDLTSDLASICTADTNRSNISGFSFFKKRNSIDSRYSTPKKNGMKYNVKAVPYDVFAK